MDTRRAVDITVATLAMPLLAFATAAAWVTQRKSPFYTQERFGLDGVPFRILKFRTMNTDRSLPIAQRVGRLGRLARRIGADELPQFVNILKGEMSLIGPRPMSKGGSWVGRFTTGRKSWDRRHKIKPGLIPPSLFEEKLRGTGYISPHKRLRADMLYIRARRAGYALPEDLRLIWAAMKVVATGRVDPQAHVPPPKAPQRVKPSGSRPAIN